MQTSTLCYACNKGRPITDSESGEVVCSECGLVSSERSQESRAEWRNFSGTPNRGRTGSPASLAIHDLGLSTKIGRTNSDSDGRRLGAAMEPVIHRLRTWNYRIQAGSAAQRNLMRAFVELERVKDKLGLSDAVIEKTAYIYRKAQGKGLVRGRTISSILAGCIYMACREMEVSRTLRDISEATHVKRNAVSASFRIIVNELDMKMPMVDPIKCIVKVANRMGISEKSKRISTNTMKDITRREISAGKVPMGLAATVLYLACQINGEHAPQREIAEAAGITEATIRNRIRDLKDKGLV
jgi:transcription initiation factor TFIIB